jgi:hypothetical protein
MTKRKILGALAATAALNGALFGASTVNAGAAPSNAPSSLSGPFSCDNGDTGTFVVNSGNANGTTWNVAHLTLDSGAGVFHPSAFNLTFSLQGVPQGTQIAQKQNQSKGLVTCDISANQGPFSLSGTVMGNITNTG